MVDRSSSNVVVAAAEDAATAATVNQARINPTRRVANVADRIKNMVGVVCMFVDCDDVNKCTRETSCFGTVEVIDCIMRQQCTEIGTENEGETTLKQFVLCQYRIFCTLESTVLHTCRREKSVETSTLIIRENVVGKKK